MTPVRLTGKQGFSLIEILVVVGIVAIVGGSAMTLLISSQNLFPLVSDREQFLRETNQAMAYITELLMESGLVRIVDIGTKELPGDPLNGTGFIVFQIPFVENGQVQLDADGAVSWGSFNWNNGFLLLDLDDIAALPVEDPGPCLPDPGPCLPSTSLPPPADAGQNQETMLALKDQLSELLLPTADAARVPMAQGRDEATAIKMFLREYRDAGLQDLANFWILSNYVNNLQFDVVNGRLEVRIWAEKTNWKNQTIGTSATTEIILRN